MRKLSCSQVSLLILVLGGTLATSCAYPAFDAGTEVATGGAPGVGGATATGGKSDNSSGGNSGALASGGMSQSSAGGTNATAGGAFAFGGVTSGGGIATGGNRASGGTTTLGGTTSTTSGVGGTLATGGTSGTAGTVSTGGIATILGGASATGGTKSSGGSVATGGSTSTGGATAAGGVLATGGVVNVGGTTATGGKLATGGSLNTGGDALTGGAYATGGVMATGGATAATSGATACAPSVLSLSANGTGTAADTANAHIEADLNTDLPIGNAKRTIEFWAYIKTTDWVGEDNEIFYYGSAGTAMAFGLDFGTNPVAGSTTNHATLNPFTNGGFTLDSTDNLGINSSTAQWVHIAMTWDGAALLTYVNGLPKITVNATGGVTALATATSVLSIGCNPTNNRCFSGNFAEFRVWNIARAATDILANYNKPAVGNEAGLVAYWKFDDAPSATTAADSVTTAAHTAHPGTLKADTTAHNPTFVVPTTPVPLICP
jgi:hypothetical protein